ncbi:MAG: hypothetical protein ABI950_02475 [Solirubrobacteraceae bacterium]
MEELAPGLYDWTARHEGHGQIVHSHYLADGGVVIDPMGPPPDGLPGDPRLVVLTSRHHLRHAASYGVPIVGHEAGLHEFEGSDVDVRPFAFGDELSPGVRALEVGVLTPEETALHLDVGDGWLALADAVMRDGDGALGFVPDGLIGDDPEGVKDGLRDALRRILGAEEFGGLLLAHGAPGTRAELDAFVAA